jgi:hypothetical protein
MHGGGSRLHAFLRADRTCSRNTDGAGVGGSTALNAGSVGTGKLGSATKTWPQHVPPC